MDFTVAYLQYAGSGPMRLEEQLLTEGLGRLGIPVRHYSIKRIHRRQLPLGPDAFLAGDLPAVHAAMRQLGIPIPPPDDYPETLAAFLGRKVWTTTLGAVERMMESSSATPVFVKPAEHRKSFTGSVCYSERDFGAWGGASRRQRVWCSEVVTWLSEFRVYVIDGRVVATDHYAGDDSAELDTTVVRAAIDTYHRDATAPSAYAVDFGVLANGDTALVEVNDGYALGAYRIAADHYTELLATRWRELLATAS
ncbi:ATP-grasp domain-containing protein [Nocardia caishijiensis]|uniref:Uncharacterized protein DUF4343 n=1 Tax=Nocardia caishijiensis TaxID=184756 RepID=A0ABQ6YJA2_9NOCA|nr:ATP-grasp domain-containing protein [Nocardia caishijiensis]KAF0845718.1 uncharacterized protein DUF4343 [Nocardia caishijiensis]